MKVFLTPPQPDLGLQRIATALRRYAPPQVEICQFPRNVDLTVIYAIGRRNAIQRQADEITGMGKKYAAIQVCLRSTMAPYTDDWYHIWNRAACVWSYYDLHAAIQRDGDNWTIPNFYHAPLGADSEIFCYHETQPKYVIATSGFNRLQESIRECILAADAVGKNVFHLGRSVNWGQNVTSAVGISDEQLAREYSACEFVSGLRRTEGFELPAVEGLLCGARPIVFDTPDYHFNYRDFAEYIHEGTRAEVVDQLTRLFTRGARPVTAAERVAATCWFDWKRICGEFWERCLQP